MNWFGLLENLGAFAIGSGLLVWLIKQLVSQSLSRDLEAFKADLRKAHAVEIERLKADLRTASFEHQTRFVRLHETRAEIIAELYKRLVKAEDAIYTLLGDVQPAEQKEREELFQSTGELTGGLVQFFQEHRIYFDEELCARLGALALNFQQAWLHGSPYVTVSLERREQTQKRLNERMSEF